MDGIVSPRGELLYGAPAIAAFLGITERQARHLADKARIPTWKEGKLICARRASLEAWMLAREAAGRPAAVHP